MADVDLKFTVLALSRSSRNGTTPMERLLCIWTKSDELKVRYLEVMMMPGSRMHSMKLAKDDRKRERSVPLLWLISLQLLRAAVVYKEQRTTLSFGFVG